MDSEKKDADVNGSKKRVLLRDYAREMGDRIASLRGHASGDAGSGALGDALQELESARGHLSLADEEISFVEARFEETLRVLEARARHYAELFDGAPDGYALTDALGVVREGNRTLGAMLGVPKRFFEGKPLVNFVARGDVRAYRDWLGGLLRGEKNGELISLRLRPRHGGPVFIAEVMASVVRGVGDRVTSIRWSVRKETRATAHAEAAPHAGEKPQGA